MTDPRRQARDVPQDAMATRIGQAVMLHQGGDREEARNRLTRLWAEACEHGDLFHRCAIAHYLADTQDDPGAELEWDLRALAAARALTADEAARGEHVRAVRSLYPALYLNLAADHAGLGDPGAARRELARAREALGELPDDPYGAGVRAAVERLERRLEGSGASDGRDGPGGPGHLRHPRRPGPRGGQPP